MTKIERQHNDQLQQGIFGSAHGPASEDGGAIWRQQRKIAASIFTRNNFKVGFFHRLFEDVCVTLWQNFMRDTFVEKGNQFVEIVDNYLKSGQPAPLNLQGMFFGFTMDRYAKLLELSRKKFTGSCVRSIMKIFFARKTNTLGAKYDPFTDAFDESQRQMLKSFDGFQFMLFSRVAPFPFGGSWNC